MLNIEPHYTRYFFPRSGARTRNARLQSKYVLSTPEDYDILAKAMELEKIKLSKTDREVVALIRTQLERNWRKHLLKKLEELLEKYN